MSKNKSVFVVVLMAVMLLAIAAGLFRLHRISFFVLTGVFAFYGFLHCTADFRRWLCVEGDHEPYSVPDVFAQKEDPVVEHEVDRAQVVVGEPLESESLDALLEEFGGSPKSMKEEK